MYSQRTEPQCGFHILLLLTKCHSLTTERVRQEGDFYFYFLIVMNADSSLEMCHFLSIPVVFAVAKGKYDQFVLSLFVCGLFLVFVVVFRHRRLR